MINALLVALVAGFASALFYGAFATGSVLFALLFIAAPLPILLAGLGWHPLVAALAALIACIILSLAERPEIGLAYGGMIGLPAYLLAEYTARRVFSATPDAALTASGIALVGLALYCAAITIGTAALITPDYAALQKQFSEVFDSLAAGLAIDPASAERTGKMGALLAQIVLPATASMLFTMHVFATTFALALAARFGGKAGATDAARTRLPTGTLGLLLMAFAGSTLGGYSGAFALGVVGSLLSALMLMGLAVVHVRTRNKSYRGIVLSLSWLSVLIIGLPAALFVGIGFVDHLFDLRRSRPPAPDASSS